MAFWNRPAASGETICEWVLSPPADSPKIVTLVGSPPKSGDVGLDPLQRGLLVHQAVVARCAAALAGERRMRQEAEGAEAIVDRHDHHALSDERPGVVVIALAGEQRAAVDPHHDRVRADDFRRVDVEVETVFRAAGDAERARRLGAMRRERARIARHIPGGRRLRRLPAQRSHRRRCVGDAAVRKHRVRPNAADDSLVGRNRGDGVSSSPPQAVNTQARTTSGATLEARNIFMNVCRGGRRDRDQTAWSSVRKASPFTPRSSSISRRHRVPSMRSASGYAAASSSVNPTVVRRMQPSCGSR